jgi:hypothetical protein
MENHHLQWLPQHFAGFCLMQHAVPTRRSIRLIQVIAMKIMNWQPFPAVCVREADFHVDLIDHFWYERMQP